MKKGFGWFFCILGGLNIIRGIIMLEGGTGGGILVFGIGFIVLGIWMINTSKPKEDKNFTNSVSEYNRSDKDSSSVKSGDALSQKRSDNIQDKSDRGINSFYDLEKSILLMRNYMPPQMDKGFASEIGEGFSGMFAETL